MTARALGSRSSEVFPQYFALLSAWLLDACGAEPFPPQSPFADVKANPSGPSHPDVFLLCSSVDTARFAGMAGVGMVFAEFIARTDGMPAVAAYRESFQPSIYRDTPMAGVATIAMAADTAEEAERLTAMMPRPPSRPGDDSEEGERFIRRIRGDARTVRNALAEKARHTGADELFVMSIGPDLASRLRSLELIAAEGVSV